MQDLGNNSENVFLPNGFKEFSSTERKKKVRYLPLLWEKGVGRNNTGKIPQVEETGPKTEAELLC